MNSTHTTFPCGDIILEGEWHLPEGSGSLPGVVVCHPHPLYGGNMLNNVVLAVCQALVQHSVAAFRFNFRGVGSSGGVFGDGIAEQEDVRAALALVSSPDIDSKRVGLAGYSFGASVALPVALEHEGVGLLALVSPPLADAGWKQLQGYQKPKLVIAGDADLVVLPERLQRLKAIPNASEYEVVAGADHFWWGYEEELAQRVARFFVDGFNQL